MERNVKLIYGLAFFHSFMIIVPVIVPFFMSMGLSLAEIFYLQAVYACTIVLLEAPSGYVADVFGRRSVLLLGGLLHGLAYFCLNFADDLLTLLLFEFLAGIATSMLSGADLAMLYDSQKSLNNENSPEHSSGIAHLGFLRSLAEGLGALLGGVLAMKSFELMVLMQSVCAWMCLLLSLGLADPPVARQASGKKKLQIQQVLKHLLRSDPVLRQLVLAIPLYTLVTFHAAWLIQPYWESQGIALAFFGVLWCCQSVTVAAANKLGFSLERRFGAAAVLLLIGLLPVAGHFGLAWNSGGIGIAMGLLLFLSRGLSQVILVNALNRRVPSEFRATANSFTSFLFRLSFIITGPVVGYIAELAGLRGALTLLGLAAFVLFVLVMLPLIRVVRTLQKELVM